MTFSIQWPPVDCSLPPPSGPRRKPSWARPNNCRNSLPRPLWSNPNPLNRADAVRIHAKFRELALYKGKDDTVWSGASRVALTKFKTKYGLGQDDVWDAATEQRLFSLVPDRPAENPRDAFSAAVAGTWVTDIRACPGGEGGTDAVPISITAVRAEAEGADASSAI